MTVFKENENDFENGGFLGIRNCWLAESRSPKADSHFQSSSSFFNRRLSASSPML